MLLTRSKIIRPPQNQKAPLHSTTEYIVKIFHGGSASTHANVTEQPTSKTYHVRSLNLTDSCICCSKACYKHALRATGPRNATLLTEGKKDGAT